MNNQDIIRSWSEYPIDEVEAFGDDGDFSRQYLLNPVLLKLMGNISGKHILDAGSGTGYLSRKLARNGAMVTAIEPADNLYNYSQKREQEYPLHITYIKADLSDCSLKANSFDIVVANMVFMDIPRYQDAMHNCIRALRVGGVFIFSILHPCFDEEDSKAYLDRGYIKVTDYLHGRQDSVRFGYTFHRPLSEYMSLCLANELCLTHFIEPQLDDNALNNFPKHIRNAYVPSFIVLRWRK